MPSNFASLTVTLFKESGGYSSNVAITDDVKSIPLFTDTGTGEVNSATIIVRSLDGLYNVTGSVKFEEFDRIRIQCTDLGGQSYDRYFEIFNILPSQTKGEGTLLTLECLGIEYHTQQIHMAKPYYFEDSYTVAQSIGNIYSSNKGSKQPTLTGHDQIYTSGNGYGNGFPYYNANNWEYGLNEDTCYNRWMDLIDNGGAPVGAGGALTFFELNFLTTGVNAMQYKLRASGDNSTKVQVKNAVATGVKVGEQEGMLSNPTGTRVLAWGSGEHGSLPVGNSKYDSGLLSFIFRPEWAPAIYYKADAKVKVITVVNDEEIEKHYKCTTSHTSGSSFSATNWTQIDMSDEFGDTQQYSQWTDDKATLWKYSGCNAPANVFTNGGWIDCNMAVHDQTFFRTWVDARATSDSDLNTLKTKYSYDSTDKTKFPRGFRVLVNGTGSGDLADFDDCVAEYQPTNSVGGLKWRKLYSFSAVNDSDAPLASGSQVAVIDEGKIYQDTISGTGTSLTHSWSAIDTTKYGNDCFHAFTTAPANTDGVDLVDGVTRSKYGTSGNTGSSTKRPDIIKSGTTGFTKNVDSAVSFIATASALTNTNDDGGQANFEANASATSGYYTNAIGFTLRFPFPVYNDGSGGITEEVGDTYGGGANNKYEPATLDIQNMNYSSGGKEGFGHDEVEDYGQINAVAFWLNYSQVLTGTSAELNDEHRFRAWFMDTKDNVVYQDFVVKFSQNWEDIRLPISGFRIYRARRPVYGWSVFFASIIPPKELEVINIFEWRNIKFFGVQLQSQYDKYGRFNPGQATIDESGNSVTWANLASMTTGITRTLKMDGFRFIKPLLASSGTDSERNLEPAFQQFPSITVYDQLQNVAQSHLEIEKFKHKEFNIESVGDDIFDIPFGNSFYLNNVDIVSDDDKSGDDNNIELVAKRIEYSITKPTTGKGGLRRKIKGVKVFT